MPTNPCHYGWPPEGRLALLGHGRILVAAPLGQIARRVETERVVFGDVFRREHRAVLGKGERQVVLLPQLRQDFLRRAGLAVGLFDHVVRITGGLGEKEDFFGASAASAGRHTTRNAAVTAQQRTNGRAYSYNGLSQPR